MAFAAGLLGTHVSGCAADATALAIILFLQCQSEIGKVGPAFRVQKDVRRFHVPMDQPSLMSMVQGVSDRGRQFRRLANDSRVSLSLRARSVPSMNLATTKQSPSSYLPRSCTGTIWG